METCTTITDMNADSLAECGRYLDLQDLSNMAMSCKFLKTVAYSDSIWQRWFSEHCPQQMMSTFSQASGVRESYLARRTALRQFKFVDPLAVKFRTDAKPFNHLLLDKNNDIVFSQGSMIQMIKMGCVFSGRDSLVTLNDHKARITCMRLFPLSETSVFRSETQQEENVLVTSSCDHSIRLWRKDFATPAGSFAALRHDLRTTAFPTLRIKISGKFFFLNSGLVWI